MTRAAATPGLAIVAALGACSAQAPGEGEVCTTACRDLAGAAETVTIE